MENNKTYTVKDFTEISNHDEAYLIGYLLGDGSCEESKRRMTVGSTEKYIIEFFNNMLQPNHSIASRIPVNNTRPEIVSVIESHRINLSSYFTPTFEKYGLLEFKPNRVYKNIPEEYMKAFLLGFLDTDGSITCFYGDDGKGGLRFRTGIAYTHPCRDTLFQIKNFLKSELNVGSSISYKKN